MLEIVKDSIINQLTKTVKFTQTFSAGRFSFHLAENNLILITFDNRKVDWFSSSVTTKAGETIDTLQAKFNGHEQVIAESATTIKLKYKQGSLFLLQTITVGNDDNYFSINVSVKSKDNSLIETNRINVLNFAYPNNDFDELLLSPSTKMVLVPYDNDMWVNYEAVNLAAGRCSYDVTSIFSPDTNRALLIGATEFDIWKNGIICSSTDARSFSAVSGVADSITHDCLSHGYLKDSTITSSTFVCGIFDDVRESLETYGKLASRKEGLKWNHGTIFGWNSYSALALQTTLGHIKEAADFLYDELGAFSTDEKVQYINLDDVYGLNNKALKQLIDKFHSRGQKIGTYLAPLAHHKVLDIIPLKGSLAKFRKDIVLKKPDGTDYPAIDGKYPIDITLPEAESDLRKTLKDIVSMGFDYIKLDFLSHGALEGKRYNKDIKTGRQALIYFYNIVNQELSYENTGRDIFISLAISPLFPCGYGHSRRMCCDSFGHNEDTKYLLNALKYSWWTNNQQYYFNDPDHTVLYKSIVDSKKETTIAEARSRYNSSAISGTVMLLSDNYGYNRNVEPKKENPIENKTQISTTRKRTTFLANNGNVNNIARLHKAFKPVSLAEDCYTFYLNHEGVTYVAVFNVTNTIKTVSVDPLTVNANEAGKIEGVSEMISGNYNKIINLKLSANDSIIFKLI